MFFLFSFKVSYVVHARNGRDLIPRTETRIQEGLNIDEARAIVDDSIRREVKELAPVSIVFDGTSEIPSSAVRRKLRDYWLEVIKTAASATSTGVS